MGPFWTNPHPVHILLWCQHRCVPREFWIQYMFVKCCMPLLQIQVNDGAWVFLLCSTKYVLFISLVLFALVAVVTFRCGKACTSSNSSLTAMSVCVWSDSSSHFQPPWELGVSRALVKLLLSISLFRLSVPLTLLNPPSLTYRWVATQSLRPSPWASSSSSRRRLPLLPRSRSMVCLSPSCGTSSSASRTSRTSALHSAVFTNASLSSLSPSKVGVQHHFECGLSVHVCLCSILSDTCVHRRETTSCEPPCQASCA